MVEIKENISLKKFNTFGVNVIAKYFASFKTENELLEILKDQRFRNIPKMILGGGSNVLFLSKFDGLVLHNNIKGIEEAIFDDAKVQLKIGCGEEWDDVVEYAVNKNYGGIENLSLIPGSAGAAPVQNIGAYGVELEEVFHSLEGYFVESAEKKVFKNNQCEFGYRSSVFKNELKNKFVITRVNLILTKQPQINLSYASLKNSFDTTQKEISISDVRKKVIEIRESKLPNPDELNNAGSFFKNPIVNHEQLEKLLEEYPDMIYFPLSGDKYKIAAGWIIDKTGLKGSRKNDVGTYPRQALVIVNYSAETGEEILNFAKYIQTKVLNKFGILLEPEVNII